MKEQRKAVGDLRSLLSQMQGRPAATGESEAWRAFQFNQAQLLPALEQTPRARKQRAINRISGRYQWGPETVAHFLDMKGVPYLADLSDPQLDDLFERMCAYEDSAINGWSSPDEPAAA